jgi:hypothetical protein
MYMTAAFQTSVSPLCSGEKRWTEAHTIVSSHERISVIPPDLSIHDFIRLLERNVHVSINRLQFTYISPLSVIVLCSSIVSSCLFHLWIFSAQERRKEGDSGQHTSVDDSRV